MEEDLAQLGLRTWHSWGCLWSQDGGGPGTVGAALGPGLEKDQAQLRPALGPDQKGPRHSQGLGAQDEAAPDTVWAALGPRMEEDQAQLGLLWGLGAQDGGGPGTVGAALGPGHVGGLAQPEPCGCTPSVQFNLDP